MSATATLSAFHIITTQIDEAIAATKCHKCGCLQQTVEALAGTEAGKGELAPVLAKAKAIFEPQQYDCLGCPVCYPAIAANAFAVAFPEAGAGLDLCPTEEPEERQGWPPLPGDYSVVRYGAPVAVCALNSGPLVETLVDRKPEGLAVVGTMHTENLGIERVIKNTLANPHLRFLLLCGEDTQQAVGHLPGQCFESLFQNGLDERSRIIGARGRRPVLKNVGREEVEAFLKQVELISMVGEQDADIITRQIQSCADRNNGVYPYPFKKFQIERIQAPEPKRLTLDKAGYFVVYPEVRGKRLIVEHYTNQGVLNCVLEGTSTGALYSEAIERQLVTRLDHAAYLGRELARAEQTILTGASFVQDAAPGELVPAATASCGSGSSCGCPPDPQSKAASSSYDTQVSLPAQPRGGLLMMKTRVFGLIAVVLIAVGILAYKANRTQQTQKTTAHPRVLLVADLREAGSGGDACAEIIHSVQAAQARGIAVQELGPDSKSNLLTRYHVLTIPTVLILNLNGQVVSRFEGEGPDTVAAVSSQMRQLK